MVPGSARCMQALGTVVGVDYLFPCDEQQLYYGVQFLLLLLLLQGTYARSL
jgi:hypothetical protein